MTVTLAPMKFKVRWASQIGLSSDGYGEVREFATLDDLRAFCLEQDHDLILDFRREFYNDKTPTITVYDDYLE